MYNGLLPGLRQLCRHRQAIVRCFSTTQIYHGKMPKDFWKKKRSLNVGFSKLASIPDWSHSDGRPSPPGSRITERREIQKQICQRIINLHREINTVMGNPETTKPPSTGRRLRVRPASPRTL